MTSRRSPRPPPTPKRPQPWPPPQKRPYGSVHDGRKYHLPRRIDGGGHEDHSDNFFAGRSYVWAALEPMTSLNGVADWAAAGNESATRQCLRGLFRGADAADRSHASLASYGCLTCREGWVVCRARAYNPTQRCVASSASAGR